MKATIKIPKGWRRVRAGEPIKKGDRYYDAANMSWRLVTVYHISVSAGIFQNATIRRIKRKSLKPYRFLSDAEKRIRRHIFTKSSSHLELLTNDGRWIIGAHGAIVDGVYRTRKSVSELAELQGVPVPEEGGK